MEDKGLYRGINHNNGTDRLDNGKGILVDDEQINSNSISKLSRKHGSRSKNK